MARGRKSSASMEVVSDLTPRYAQAPLDLSDEEKEEWNRVIHSKPADWFKQDTLAMLEMYCKTVAKLRKIDAQINQIPDSWYMDKEGMAHVDKMVTTRKKYHGDMVSAARSLRITNQARYDTQAAARATNKADTGGKAKVWAS